MNASLSAQNASRLAIATFVIAVIVVGAYFLMHPPSGPSSAGAAFVARGFPAEAFMSIGPDGSIHTVEIPEGDTEDYASAAGKTYAIVRDEGGGFDVLRLADGARLTEDGARKAALDISDDGAWLAYAALTNLEPGEDRNPSSWTVFVLEVATGEATPVGEGYAPQFFMSDATLMVLFTSSSGIGFANPAERTSTVFNHSLPGDIAFPAAISPDGKYFAKKREGDPAYAVYEVVAPLPDIDTRPLFTTAAVGGTVAFVEGRLLELSSEADGRAILSAYPVGGGEPMPLAELPASEVEYRLLP